MNQNDFEAMLLTNFPMTETFSATEAKKFCPNISVATVRGYIGLFVGQKKVRLSHKTKLGTARNPTSFYTITKKCGERSLAPTWFNNDAGILAQNCILSMGERP